MNKLEIKNLKNELLIFRVMSIVFLFMIFMLLIFLPSNNNINRCYDMETFDNTIRDLSKSCSSRGSVQFTFWDGKDTEINETHLFFNECNKEGYCKLTYKSLEECLN